MPETLSNAVQECRRRAVQEVLARKSLFDALAAKEGSYPHMTARYDLLDVLRRDASGDIACVLVRDALEMIRRAEAMLRVCYLAAAAFSAGGVALVWLVPQAPWWPRLALLTGALLTAYASHRIQRGADRWVRELRYVLDR